MDDLIKKDITIAEVKMNGNRFTLKDHDGMTFSFFTTKQDGTESAAYHTFKTAHHNGQFGVGDHARVTYKDQLKEMGGKAVTFHNIVSFLGGITPPTSNVSSQGKNVSPGANLAPNSTHLGDVIDIGIIRAFHNLAGSQLAAGLSVEDVIRELPKYNKLIDLIAVMEKQRRSPKSPIAPEELPVIDRTEDLNNPDLNVEGIPFKRS